METNTESTEIKDATVGIIAYITLIGFIIAIVLNGNKTGEEKKFGAFHLRQALGIIICSVGAYLTLTFLAIILMAISLKLVFIISFISLILWLGILTLIIMGIVNAVNKSSKEVPIIGAYSSKFLAKAFQ